MTASEHPPPAPPDPADAPHDIVEDLLLGKILPVAVFAFFTAATLHNLAAAATKPAAFRTLAGTLPVVHFSLTMPFCLMQTWLFLVRPRPRARTERPGERTIAFAGAFAIMFLPAVAAPVSASAPLLAAAVALELLGGSLTLWSLSHLRRHFSIIPEARGIVRSGPYAIIRHPMYFSEIVWCAGFILPVFSMGALGLYILMVTFLAMRAAFEERLLTETFPGYAEYARGTWRIVPFLGPKG